MLLKDSEGSEFELIVIGYGFPQIINDYYDSNSMNIRIRVRNSRGPWDRTGHFLNAFELRQLAIWLDAVAVEAPMINRETLREVGRNPPKGFPNLRLFDSLEFTEPNLRFVLVERETDSTIIRVFFELEARPPWAPANFVGLEDVWVNLHVSDKDLKAAPVHVRMVPG